MRLDRAGIFKAKPLEWFIRTSQQSQALALTIQFQITAQLDGSDWVDWSAYEVDIYGDFWVVKADGTINQKTVENLAKSLGWNGDLNAVKGPVPERVVQITVKEEQYNGSVQHKVAWINPEDYSPRPDCADDKQIGDAQVRFGSLLRAAAAGAVKAAPKVTVVAKGTVDVTPDNGDGQGPMPWEKQF